MSNVNTDALDPALLVPESDHRAGASGADFALAIENILGGSVLTSTVTVSGTNDDLATVQANAANGATFTSGDAGSLAYQTVIDGGDVKTGSVFASIEVESSRFRTTEGGFGGEVTLGWDQINGTQEESRIEVWEGSPGISASAFVVDAANGYGSFDSTAYVSAGFGGEAMEISGRLRMTDESDIRTDNIQINSELDAGGATILGISYFDVGALSDNATASDVGALSTSGGSVSSLNINGGFNPTLELDGLSALQHTADLILNPGQPYGETRADGVLAATGSKPFDIPHPIHADMHLRHYAMEGPEICNFYRFTVEVDAADTPAEVALPDYWTHINRKPQAVAAPLDTFGHALAYVSDGRLYVEAERPGTYAVWLTAERCDTNIKSRKVEYHAA